MPDPKAKVRIVGENELGVAFKGALRDADQFTKKLSGTFKTALGVFGVGTVVAGLKNVTTAAIQYGDDLAKAATKTGVAAGAFSELAYAAEQNDVSLDALSTSFRKLQVTLSEAASGSKAARSTFAALGVDIEALKALAPDRQFEILAEKISLLPDPADRARAAVELFGRAGADLLPLFEDGAEGIRKLREEAIATGRALTDEQIKRLAEADDAIKRLHASWSSFARTMTAAVAPALTRVLDNLTSIATGDHIGQLREQIDFLERMQGRSFLALGYGSIGTGFFDAEEGAAKLRALRQELAALQEQATWGGGAESAWRGRRGGQEGTRGVPGFQPDPEKTKQLSDKALRELERYRDQAATIATDAARAFRPTEGGGDNALEINRALTEGSSGALEALAETAERSTSEFKTATDQMSVFAEEAGRNIQGALSDFLFDPFAEGLDGMLKGFVDVLRRMAAEAAAAQILKGIGGLFSPTSFLGTFFGGFRAAGGPVEGGRAYMVGEQGPELLIPRGDGTILPNSALRGAAATALTVAPVYNIDARGNSDLERKLPAILAAHARHTVEMARKALNDDVSRGAFGRA